MAACTSRAAPSMLRLKSNCSVTDVVPRLLDDVISVMPAIRPNCRSSGVATDDAMISGLAPGKPAATVMVGKSTCGSGETGNTKNAAMPASAMAKVSSVVATGRCMNGEEMLILVRRRRLRARLAGRAGESPRQAIEVDVDHRRRIQ